MSDLPKDVPDSGSGETGDFPSFITPSSEYFDIRIGNIPEISSDSYLLSISGAVDNPVQYTLQELQSLPVIEKTVTVECIENPVGGPLIGTVTWKGFKTFDLIEKSGIHAGANIVKYICADGYYTYHTLDELQSESVIGALYMNGSPLPDTFGYPVRTIIPGYFGVRQPGWIVEIEVIEGEVEDYWSRSGWKTDTSMAVDSKIFFPRNLSRFNIGDSIRIGGAAFGGRRISGVEISDDHGKTWKPATIVRDSQEDHVWVFWEYLYVPLVSGDLFLLARATSTDGVVQPASDDDIYDGTNAWPWINITVAEGN